MDARWLPAITWLTFAITAYVLWPVVHRLRYGRSPIAERFPPRDLYGWIDFALGVCLVAYSVWIVFGPPPRPVSMTAGVMVWAAGFALRMWTVLTLGPNWRIGQDETDTSVEYVATGPYRFLKHPINAALIVVGLGQMLMTGVDARAVFLVAFAAAYYIAQARAEERFWSERRGRPTTESQSRRGDAERREEEG